MDNPSQEKIPQEFHPDEWQELRGHARHQTVEVLRLILILLQDAVILVAGFAAEFAYEHWLHSEHPFFQLALNLSSAFFLLLYVITVTVHVVQYVRGQVGATKSTRLGEYLPWAIIGGGVLAAGVALTVPNLHRKSAATGPQHVLRMVVPLPGNGQFAGSYLPLAISPDGTHLVFVSLQSSTRSQLYVRAMDSLETKLLPGTEGADTPFFSPDGQWVGFSANGVLKKIPIEGGAVITICSANNVMGASWGDNNRIVFATTISPLYQVSAAGGIPEALTTRDVGENNVYQSWPEFLPGAKALLFSAVRGGTIGDADEIVLKRLDTGEQRVLLQGGSHPHYLPTGHLVYSREGNILAVPFDLGRLQVTGPPVPVVEGIQISGISVSHSSWYSLSATGSLVYVPGSIQNDLRRSALTWVDRSGKSRQLSASLGFFASPRISPDEKHVVVDVRESGSNDIWNYDISRDTLTRLTFGASDAYPIWTPDGKRVIFRSQRVGMPNLYWKAADGSGAEERLTTSKFLQTAMTISPDGRNVVYSENRPETQYDLWVLPLEGERKPRIFMQTPFDERTAQFSPDGHWLAYLSNESGRYEIYAQPFPGPGGKYQISTDGASEMIWAKNGELFYRAGPRREKIMAVDIQTQPNFQAGKPRLLFEGSYSSNVLFGSWSPDYSVTADGQRFLMVQPQEAQIAVPAQINVVQNWVEELKQKVPVQ